MMRSHDTKNQNPKKSFFGIMKWLLIFTTIFLFLFVLTFAATLAYENAYIGRIFPGVHIGSFDMGGKTQKEAVGILYAMKDEIIDKGVMFTFHENRVMVPAEILGSDPDLSRRIIAINTDAAAKNAYEYGRNKSFVENTVSQLKTFFYNIRIPLEYTINEKQVLSILQNRFKDLEKPGRDAQLYIDGTTITTLQEQEGRVFNYEKAIQQLRQNLSELKDSPIELEMIYTKPKITLEDAKTAVPLVEEVMQTSTPTILYENNTWSLTKKQTMDWLDFSLLRNNENPSLKEIGLQFDRGKMMSFLKNASEKINIDPVDAKFELVDGRVTQFQASRNGKRVNLEMSYNKINRQYFLDGVSAIELIVDVIPPSVSTEDINNLGIKELIGVGKTNFSGSPKNRRLNIANGAKLLNGVLIKPNEEFSLLNTLKPFDSTNGFLPELVIKGDRTIPEYGGGLCQIGTTMFRVTLNAGLPITERRNHTYRVPYYEPPAGIDATIYDPSPDFKFINDTPGYILIITEVDGDDLTFKMYGTSDGRTAKIDPEKPKIFNITDPGEPRYIETDELKPGEKKLVEKPHRGADTTFDYIVTYPDGKIVKKTFFSRYVAWKETWLVGKAATSTDMMTPAAAVTPGE